MCAGADALIGFRPEEPDRADPALAMFGSNFPRTGECFPLWREARMRHPRRRASAFLSNALIETASGPTADLLPSPLCRGASDKVLAYYGQVNREIDA
jgi:hypothetical protein